MGYLTVLYIGLGAKIRDLYAKDSNSFRNRLIASEPAYRSEIIFFQRGVEASRIYRRSITPVNLFIILFAKNLAKGSYFS
jgi:hypothetical protein